MTKAPVVFHILWKLASALAFAALFSEAMAAQPKPWKEFNPAELTIIYPEESALSNPPFIHWQGVNGALRYRVRLIGQGVTETWETPYNFYLPAKPLAQGNYRVEIEVLDKDEKPSASRAGKDFRIDKPGTPDTPAMNDISFEQGKSILLSPDWIARMKSAAGDSASYRDQIIEAARKPDPVLAKPILEPKRYNNLVWDFSTWHTNNQYCFAIENGILANTMAYALTGESTFRDAARSLMLAIADWPADGATGAWENDHSAQALLHALAIGYNTFQKELDPKEKAKIAEAIRARCADMYALLCPFVMKETSSGPMNDPDNNHPWFCASALGLGGLALMGEDPRASEWVSYTTQLFWGLFLPKGDRTGGWHEGIDYWSYALFFVFQYADALKTASGVSLYRHPWLTNTAFFKIYVHPPVGAYVPFGDCKHHRPSSFDKVIMMRMASEYGDPLAWKYVDAVKESIKESRYLFYAALWSDRSMAQGRALQEIPAAKQFEDIGWVVSNSDLFNTDTQVLFAFRSGRFFGRSFGHSHADLNSFIFTAGGEKLLWDAGYYDSYLSKHHRNYSRLSDAHNTLLIDGVGQVVHIRGLNGKITRFENDGKSLLVQGDASEPLIYGGRHVRFIRTITYKDQKELVVSDDIMARELSQISFLLHSAYPILYNPSDRSIRIRGNRYELTGQFDTAEPVEAILRTKFSVEPDRPSAVLKENNQWPDEYHLELKTVNKIETWTPALRLTLR